MFVWAACADGGSGGICSWCRAHNGVESGVFTTEPLLEQTEEHLEEGFECSLGEAPLVVSAAFRMLSWLEAAEDTEQIEDRLEELREEEPLDVWSQDPGKLGSKLTEGCPGQIASSGSSDALTSSSFFLSLSSRFLIR